MLASRRRADPVPRPAPAQTARPQPLSLFRRDDRGQPARPIALAARQPQIIDAKPIYRPAMIPRTPALCRYRWKPWHSNRNGRKRGTPFPGCPLPSYDNRERKIATEANKGMNTPKVSR
jgi:hypothetical protein